MKEEDLILRDLLAVERTKLANERTFLAYFRSSIVFLATGVSVISIHLFEKVDYLGWGFIVLAPMLFFIGLHRLISVRKKIKKTIYKAEK